MVNPKRRNARRKTPRAIGAFALLMAVTGCGAPDEEPATSAPSPAVAAGDRETADAFGLAHDEVGFKVAAYLHAIDSEEHPAARLEQLRPVAREAAVELMKSYRGLASDRKFDRWKLVHTLGALRTDATIPDLTSIALEELPASALSSDRTNGHDCGNGPGDEHVIRARAVEGLAGLAREGNAAAEDALRQAVRAPSFSARRAAVMAYVRLPGDATARRREVAASLAAEDRWLLDVRPGRTEDFMHAPPPTAPSKTPMNPAPGAPTPEPTAPSSDPVAGSLTP
jgi:hypothetical protein